MSTAKTMYAVILNFENGEVDTLILDNMPPDADPEEFIQGPLDYSLSNCEWMITPNPFPNPLNF